jgi:hypothetical protein
MKKKIEYPFFAVGSQVRLSGDICLYPTVINGLSEKHMLVPDGAIGIVEGGLRWGNYVVSFPYIALLNVHATRLALVEEQPS